MWKKTVDIGYVRPILCQIKAGSQHKCMSSETDAQNVDIAPRYKRIPKVGWFRRRGARKISCILRRPQKLMKSSPLN